MTTTKDHVSSERLPSSGSAPIGQRGELAQAVAAAVDQIPSVTRSKSLLATTLYPGGRVDGIVLSRAEVKVHVVVSGEEYGRSLSDVGDRVVGAAHRALATMSDERTIAVIIDDLTPIDSSPYRGVG